MSDNLKLLEPFFIALALGALVGAEREISKGGLHDEETKKSFAGIRTFALISLLGALCLHFSKTFGNIFFVASFFGFTLFVVAAYLRASDKQDIGATTEITALLSFLYGALCITQWQVAAIVLAVFTTLILYGKRVTHGFLIGVTEKEFYATLKFTIIAFVVLPLLPRTQYLGFFNPYVIWLIVVFVSGIGFTGYALMKIMGPRRGIALRGFLGGIISSTALVSSASQESREETRLVNSLAFSSALASSTMFIRVFIEVYVINRSLIGELALPMFIMFGLGIIGSLLLWRRGKGEAEVKAINFESPFTLIPALKFGAFFTLVLFIAKFANQYLGSKGVYAASALSGLANMDAITVSLARLAHGEIPPDVAILGIIIAACVNTGVKSILAFAFGSREFARLVGTSLIFPIAAGVVAIVFLI